VKKLESIAAVCCDSIHTGNLRLVNGHFPCSVGDFVSRCGGLCSVFWLERIVEKITLIFGVSLGKYSMFEGQNEILVFI